MAKLQIPVTKSKGGFIEIDTDAVPEAVFLEMVKLGAKELINRGQSKITKTTYPVQEELAAAAYAKAQETLAKVMEGDIRFSGGKAKKASGAIMTEARRLAKQLVKDAIKDQGLKVSHYKASDITKAANELLDSDQGKEIIAKAEQNLAERAELPKATGIIGSLKADPKLVAKAEADKAAKKETLSKTQAGKPKARAKGKGKGAAQAQA